MVGHEQGLQNLRRYLIGARDRGERGVQLNGCSPLRETKNAAC